MGTKNNVLRCCRFHIDRPSHARGLCKSCYVKELKKRNPQYAQEQREAANAWSALHLATKRKRNAAYYTQLKRERYRRQKRYWVECMGGHCKDCSGTFPACCFQFHHRNPKTKKFSIGSGADRSVNSVRRELKKCDLLCANCHFIRHEILKGKHVQRKR